MAGDRCISVVTVPATDESTTNGIGVTDLITGVTDLVTGFTASYTTQDGGGVGITNTGMVLTYMYRDST